MTGEDMRDFARRFMAAIQAGDAETLRGLYHPDATIWHNTDGIEQSVEQNLRLMAWMQRTLPDRTYRVQRVEALPDGFVQQHVLEATLPNGQPWRLDACAIVRVTDGRVTRLDEYLDSAQANQLSAALAGQGRP